MRVGRAGGVGMVILLLWGGGGPGPSGSVLLGSTHPPSALSGAHAPAARDLADRYVAAIEEVNRRHAAKPGKNREASLRLPKNAGNARDALLELDAKAPDLADALATAAEAALDLARVEDFDRIRARLAVLDADRAAALGVARTSERVLYLGLGGLDEAYLTGFATVFEAVLDGYDEVFGFAEWSKVPGKKLRVRVHREKEITRPPHFAPQFPYHSEIDFPVVDPERFRSPTAKGQFLFYGLCHELGHVIAMWGTRQLEEDRHAWAHYTGIVVLEHLQETRAKEPWIALLKDHRWRSMASLRDEVEDVRPSLEDRAGVLALYVQLHDGVGPRAIGSAMNRLDAAGSAQRVNRVRYYRMAQFRDALVASVKGSRLKKAVAEAFRAAGVG